MIIKYCISFCALCIAYTIGFKNGYTSMHTSNYGQCIYKTCIKELENRCQVILNPIQQDTCIARVFKLKMIIDKTRIE